MGPIERHIACVSITQVRNEKHLKNKTKQKKVLFACNREKVINIFKKCCRNSTCLGFLSQTHQSGKSLPVEEVERGQKGHSTEARSLREETLGMGNNDPDQHEAQSASGSFLSFGSRISVGLA